VTAVTGSTTTTAMTAKATEENPAKSQQSESLPKINLAPSEKHGRQPVPQVHHHFAENRDENCDREWGYKEDPLVPLDPLVLHDVFLISL
jgi:hypothetical protein